jgi:hypothetical protein
MIARLTRVHLTKARKRHPRNRAHFSDYGETRKRQNLCSHLHICNSKGKHCLVSPLLLPLVSPLLLDQPRPKVTEQLVGAPPKVQTYKQLNRLLQL